MKIIRLLAAVLCALALFALATPAQAAVTQQFTSGQQEADGIDTGGRSQNSAATQYTIISERVEVLGLIGSRNETDASDHTTPNGELAVPRAAGAAAAPAISTLSSSTLMRSGRLEISGSGFGTRQGGDVVLIGGALAIVSSWADSRIVAYVPETAPVGADSVQVVTAGGSSNTLPLNVTLRPAAGRVQWRFQVDDLYVQGRPAVGVDGTVYAAGVEGHLYALTASGGLKWIYSVAPLPVQQSVAVGADGTVYFAAGNTLNAVNPDGTRKWQIADPSGASVVIGPDIGPDGNVYAVTSLGTDDHLGLFSATPAGTIRWNRPGFVVPRGRDGFTLEIVFTPGQFYFTINRVDGSAGIFAYNFAGERLWVQPASGQPAVAPDNSIYVQTVRLANSYAALGVFSTAGNLERTLFGDGTVSLTSPDVGPDGTLYIGQNYGNLLALNGAGDQKWARSNQGYVQSPIVNEQNTVVAVGRQGSDPLIGYVEAYSPAGSLLWSYALPTSDRASILPMSRPRFSTDGTALYVGMTNNTAQDTNSWVYAFTATVAGTPPPTATSAATQTAAATTTALATANATSTATPTPPASASATSTATPCRASFSDVAADSPFYHPVAVLACNGVISGYADGSFRPGTGVTRGQLAKIIALAAGITAQVPAQQQTFRDMPPSGAFWLYVEQLYARGTISGYDCGAACLDFRPGSGATRGQIAKIVANAASVQTAVPAGQQTFRDVPPSDPFWLYVERLSTRNVISGYDSDPANISPCSGQPESGPGRYFRACSLTTRGQLAKVAASAFYPGEIAP